MILTIDLGSSATKAGLWRDDGLVAVGHSRLATQHRAEGRVEQDPSTWWPSVVKAGRDAVADRAGDVDAVVFSAARQTIALVTDEGVALGAALLWSDRRATVEAEALARRGDGATDSSTRTGMVLDGTAVAAKLAWLERHDAERLAAAAWIVTPRDLLVWELTGVLVTDATMASASGLYDSEGTTVPELVGPSSGKLPQVVPPDTVVGKLRPESAAALGIRPGVPVVVGAGDRPCEVLGTGASATWPMAAWGTTANVSIPVAGRPERVPDGLIVTRGALGGWMFEGGLSAAGSLLEWLARLTSVPVDELVQQAATSPVGSRGVMALPWMGGARAPWWRDDAKGGLVGLGFEHGPGDLARAVLEAVALDLVRCLGLMGDTGPAQLRGLVIGGSTATTSTWLEVLAGVSALPSRRRRSGEGAMAGAALVASAALGAGFDLERINPVSQETTPDPDAVRRYAALRPSADHVAVTGLSFRTGHSR